jgi:amidohydrolase
MTIDVEDLYRDLHKHPELSFQEFRTAGIAASHLRDLGFKVHEKVGRTGVVGVIENGPGPVVMLRADMDGLPVKEATGLEYASTGRATDHTGKDVPVMHACGHDVHVACLIGALEKLIAQRGSWSGTLIAVFQPAEEWGGGAQAMIDDGLFDLVAKPDVVMGQHVIPMPAGWFCITPGVALAAIDSLNITIHGQGGHGSRPEAAVDPVLMAAATTLRLQGVVAQEVAAADSAVLTVGQIHAGTKNNIIPPSAMLGLTLRTFNETTRQRMLSSIERVVRGEAAASGAPLEPEFDYDLHYPVTVNDPEATIRTASALARNFGSNRIVDPGAISGSEDVGLLAAAAGVPLVFWFIGGNDPGLSKKWAGTGELPEDVPSNHSPLFAPQIQPTLSNGVDALVVAALEWLT